MCEAETDDALMAELSNLLHHLFRLSEHCWERRPGFDTTERSTADLRAARGASWARNFDTHQLFRLAPPTLSGLYSRYYTALYGVQIWVPLSSLPAQSDKHGRHLDYQAELEGKIILDTLRGAFDAMAALL
jgi:hypothetical protein